MRPKCSRCRNIKDMLRSADYNRRLCDEALRKAGKYAEGRHWLCMNAQLKEAGYYREEAARALRAVQSNAESP